MKQETPLSTFLLAAKNLRAILSCHLPLEILLGSVPSPVLCKEAWLCVCDPAALGRALSSSLENGSIQKDKADALSTFSVAFRTSSLIFERSLRSWTKSRCFLSEWDAIPFHDKSLFALFSFESYCAVREALGRPPFPMTDDLLAVSREKVFMSMARKAWPARARDSLFPVFCDLSVKSPHLLLSAKRGK